MKRYTISMHPMTSVTEEQLDGLFSQFEYLKTRDSLRAILTDGRSSNAVEHIKEGYVREITAVLDSLNLKYQVILEQ
jgi:hypothetical protein